MFFFLLFFEHCFVQHNFPMWVQKLRYINLNTHAPNDAIECTHNEIKLIITMCLRVFASNIALCLHECTNCFLLICFDASLSLSTYVCVFGHCSSTSTKRCFNLIRCWIHYKLNHLLLSLYTLPLFISIDLGPTARNQNVYMIYFHLKVKFM